MFAKAVRRNILAIAKAYGKAEGISLSTVSKRAYGNGTFLSEIQSGANVSVDKVDNILAFFREKWPTGTPWPQDIAPVHMGRRQGIVGKTLP